MKFYLNQKSLPIIRRCQNCRFYKNTVQTCLLNKVSSAYDHRKMIYLKVSDNLYCPSHEFFNEQELIDGAIEIELNSIQEAMDMINERKTLNSTKRDLYNE